MAYPSEQAVRAKLPANGPGVSPMQLSEYIADGIYITTLGNESATETPLSRKAVEYYARAEALKQMNDQGDRINPAAIQRAEDMANRYMDEYRSSTLSTEDDSPTRPVAIIRSTPW